MNPETWRYHLPKKAIKSDCPQCGPNHRRTWSRYVDARTGDPLPEAYGRCDRESNCGYCLSPYAKGPAGMSYAEEVFQAESRQQLSHHQATVGSAPPPRQSALSSSVAPPPPRIYTLPDELCAQSLGHYQHNQFARLLRGRFGNSLADELLRRFRIGTSSRWPGACIFWYIDEQGRLRGGQIKLLDADWHTVKDTDRDGRKRSRTDWVHSAYAYQLDRQGQARPDWLVDYLQHGERCPCLFGLPQLLTAPADQPVALVEAPKTAVICTAYFPRYIWLAVGGLSYLTTKTCAGLQRLAPLKGRKVLLVPDLSTDGGAFGRWSRVAQALRPLGYRCMVWNHLEQWATDQQKAAGLDVADFLLEGW